MSDDIKTDNGNDDEHTNGNGNGNNNNNNNNSVSSDGGNIKGERRRRKRRWGDASELNVPSKVPSSSTTAAAAATTTAAAATPKTTVIDSKAKALALQESIRARLEALKAKTGSTNTTTTTTTSMTNQGVDDNTNKKKRSISSTQPAATTLSQSVGSTGGPGPVTKRAKHYELDMTVTGPPPKTTGVVPPKKVNPYLAHHSTAPSVSSSSTSQVKVEMDQKHNKNHQQLSQHSLSLVKGEAGNATVADDDDDDDIDEDDRVQAAKVRKRGKAINFVKPGTFTEIAERKRQKALNAQQSGFQSGRKAGTFFQAQTMMTNIYGPSNTTNGDSTDLLEEEDENYIGIRSEANEKTIMPQVMEWWDLEILPSKLKKQVGAYEGQLLQQETQRKLKKGSDGISDSNIGNSLESTQAQRQLGVLEDPKALELQLQCFQQAAISYCKTAALIQHIVPIKPLNAQETSKAQPVLYLTKKERKRQRKLRREEQQRELRDLQAAGLVPAPEPRLTLSNFIQVLGDQAYLDPSQMESRAKAQMEARQRAHMERNEAAKLTKEQRSAKLARKLAEDTTQAVHVALFYVKDMSHPYHRTKVDLNAQQLNITGGVIEAYSRPQLACVIAEGGPKAIKRYIRLMTVRMKWKGFGDEDDEDDDDEEHQHGGHVKEENNGLGEDETDTPVVRPKFNAENKCELVWTGMATKRFFKGFVFQACETGKEAAAILRGKGVGHFWDQIISHAAGKTDPFSLKLLASDNDDEEDNDDNDNDGNVNNVKIEMTEAMEEG